MTSVGAVRRAELRAMLIAIAVLALVVAAFAAAASNNDPGSVIEAGAAGDDDDDADGTPKADRSGTGADSEVAQAHEEHAAGPERADDGAGHDLDADPASHEQGAGAKAPASATPAATCPTAKALVAAA
ncbi:MAG: hypothetical protein SGJ13_05915, partial [Actinomycetota bacterium]|nr:hypothetical protein [Actinomycetota bacterium]